MTVISTGVPYGLLRHQGLMLKTSARILLQVAGRSILTPRASAASAQAPVGMTIQRTIAAPPARLVEQYIRWCGAAGSYEGQLPPHMVSQWSLPLVGELLMQLPYRLAGVINQGVSMTVHGPLPCDTALTLSASIESMEPAARRVRVVVAIITGAPGQARLVETRLHMSFPLPGKRPPKTAAPRPPDPAWHTAGQWRADASDGLRFALLTGDFNPIHWCGPLARRSVFGCKVLQGFGSLARSIEALGSGGFRELDVRFLRPVPLPCPPLSVQLASEADADGWRALRLAGEGEGDGDGGTVVHLAGRLR
jgi:hypothetical protein